ncbi:MAG: DUF975 family protein [Prevotellaceae bacterium]|jgi:uncharacterized membrane protein|nr:DUF975 family protein [Prevotellaceae bacterium]
MKRISQLKDEGFNALEGQWMKSALVVLVLALIYFLVYCVSNYRAVVTVEMLWNVIPWMVTYPHPVWSTVGMIVAILLIPLYYGFNVAMLQIKRGGRAEVAVLFSGFKDYQRVFLTDLLLMVYVFLWTLLLIIPGIIKYLSYSMTNYILKDRPELAYDAAIRESMRMMKGHKWKLFLLYLSFIGWLLLCQLTLGIGIFFFYPYVYVTEAAFYDNLKGELSLVTDELSPVDE